MKIYIQFVGEDDKVIGRGLGEVTATEMKKYTFGPRARLRKEAERILNEAINKSDLSEYGLTDAGDNHIVRSGN